MLDEASTCSATAPLDLIHGNEKFSAQRILEVAPTFEPENVQMNIRSWISPSPMSVPAGRRELNRNAV